MNRQILFRGKRVNNGKQVEGYLFDDGYQEPRHVFVGGLVIDEYKGTACDEWDINGINFCDVDPDTICQYTGEKDKNGQKIFDGDILEAHLDDSFPEDVTRVRVTWENMKWCLVQKGKIPDPFETGEGKYWEVIGNIFDNPELIGETKDGESR